MLNACLDAQVPGLKLVPVAVAYDLVLEDHVIARQKVKRSQKAFSREIAELVRYAVGYRSRAFVTFGKPIALDGIDPESQESRDGADAPRARRRSASSTKCCRRRCWPRR